MSLVLPLQGTEVRAMFEVQDLADYKKLPTFPDAKRSAIAYMKSDRAVSSVNSLVLRASGEIWLIQVGPRGGWKMLWNFGNPLGGQ